MNMPPLVVGTGSPGRSPQVMKVNGGTPSSVRSMPKTSQASDISNIAIGLLARAAMVRRAMDPSMAENMLSASVLPLVAGMDRAHDFRHDDHPAPGLCCFPRGCPRAPPSPHVGSAARPPWSGLLDRVHRPRPRLR